MVAAEAIGAETNGIFHDAADKHAEPGTPREQFETNDAMTDNNLERMDQMYRTRRETRQHRQPGHRITTSVNRMADIVSEELSLDLEYGKPTPTAGGRGRAQDAPPNRNPRHAWLGALNCQC